MPEVALTLVPVLASRLAGKHSCSHSLPINLYYTTPLYLVNWVGMCYNQQIAPAQQCGLGGSWTGKDRLWRGWFLPTQDPCRGRTAPNRSLDREEMPALQAGAGPPPPSSDEDAPGVTFHVGPLRLFGRVCDPLPLVSGSCICQHFPL